MHFILDIIIVAILAVFVFLAYRRGLIKTLFSLLGTVIAFLGALAFKGAVGGWIDQAFVRPSVRSMVLSTLSGTPVLEYEKALSSLDVAEQLYKMPKSLIALLESVGLSSQDIIDGISSVSTNTVEAKNQLIDSIAAPISATISTAIAFIVLFIVLLVVCKVGAKLLSALLGLLPLGKQFNRVGGAVIGLAEGVLIVLILTAVIWAVSHGIKEGLCSAEMLEKTLITKEIIKINPICNLF